MLLGEQRNSSSKSTSCPQGGSSGEARVVGSAPPLSASHPSCPFVLFNSWYDEAKLTESPWPNAVNVATVSPDGRPSSRTVLMQKHSAEKGFAFYTNYESQKGQHISGNGFVAMTFYWPKLSRQVRIEGRAEVAAPEESDAYFAQRPRGHKISAWASSQSAVMCSDEDFTSRIDEVESRFNGQDDIPRPSHCGLYYVNPDRVEFWCEGANRRHQRLVYTKDDTADPKMPTTWSSHRLFP